MNYSRRSLARALLSAGFFLTFALVSGVSAAEAIPNPCNLITAAELAQIVGPLRGSAKPGDIASGDVSCEFTPMKGPTRVSLTLHNGDLGSWRRRNGGANPQSLPEFGKDAFANPDFEGSAELYAKKGDLVLRVSMPKAPAAVDLAKAIARKALARL
jgi:hypothetical protein